MMWCSTRMCQTHSAFWYGDRTQLPVLRELLVLDTFEHETTVNGETVVSFGMVFTSRAVFGNVLRAVKDQGNTLVMSTDGTYRIHFGGWTLVDCGSVGVEFTRGGFVQRFRPWVYMFVRIESEYAYERMSATIVKYAREFYDVPVDVRSASIDHAECIASAIETTWPRCEVLTCWRHLSRQAGRKAALLKHNSFYQDSILQHLHILHSTRSHKQFLGIVRVVVSFWRENKENSYADWFESVYLTPRWARWAVNSSSIAGFLPSQQPIESHHAVIKTVVTDYKSAPTATVLNSVIPRLLLYDTTNLSSSQCAHFAEGPLITSAVVKAHLHLIKAENHQKEHGGKRRPHQSSRKGEIPTRIYFNSSKSMVKEGSLCGSLVTPERIRIFKASLGGTISRASTVDTLRFDYLSLQVVTIDVKAAKALPRFESVPLWSAQDISLVRAAMKCSCKSYMLSGWSCSHIVATLSLLNLFDVEVAVARVPRGPGRPPSTRADRFYALKSLEERFTRDPSRALMWPFVEEFKVQDGGVEQVGHRVGQVTEVFLNNEGIYNWKVQFISGGSKAVDVLDLAVGIRCAHIKSTR